MIKNTSAFSLIELLTVLAMFSILCTIAMPNYRNFIEQNRADAVIIQLYKAIQLTRSEAIKRKSIVSICPTFDNQNCTNENNWNKYIIFINKDDSKTISNKNQIIKVFDSPSKKGKLKWRGFPNKNILEFNSFGFTNYQNGTFTYCPENNDNHFAKELFIIQSGRARFSKDNDFDGVH